MSEAGTCLCGCGETPPLAAKTDRRYNQRKGEPLDYVPGHNPRGKGWNLRKESRQRDLDEALIRQRWKDEQKPAPPEPEPEPEGGAPLDGLSDADRQRATWAFQELRRRHWERPVLDADGRLCARPLDEEMVLPWESLDEIGKEVPNYGAWWVEETSIGFLLHGPGRLPELLDPEDTLPFSTIPPSRKRSPCGTCPAATCEGS